MIKNTVINNTVLSDAGLSIKTGGSAVVAAANDYIVSVENLIKTVAASDMPALTGTIADNFQSSYIFSIDEDGNLSVTKGDDVAITSDIQFFELPELPAKESLIGGVVIKNETGSVFTAGTTALDTANLTVVYFNGNGFWGK